MHLNMKANRDSKDKPFFKTIALLSGSHIVNDSYMNLFPPLLPFLIPALGLSIAQIGWITTAFSVTSSLSQLAIGYLSDRIGGRFFIFLGPLVAATFMSSIGLIHNYALMAIAVSIAGLGVASFHPPSSAITGSIDSSKSGRAMSLFTLGGNLGWTLMPLLAVPLVLNFGLKSTPILAIPGLIAAFSLFLFAPNVSPGRRDAGASFVRTVKSEPVAFSCLLASVAFRSLSFFALVTFLPKYLTDHGFTPMESGVFLSILTFSGAIGGLFGGFISDSIGRKPVIVTSLALATPFLGLPQLSSNQFLMGLWLALAGAALLGSFSVTVVAAQEIFPDNKAIASSLALGFGLGLGGIGVGLLGSLASVIGLNITVAIIAALPLAAATFALGLPGRAGQVTEARIE